MSVQALYQNKRTSAAEAVRLVRDGEQVVVPTGAGEPPALLTALSEAGREFRGVTVAQLLPLGSYGYLGDGTLDHVRDLSLFYGGPSRHGGQQGWIDFVPNSFSDMPLLIERGYLAADVVFALASPMDDEGNFALSLATDYTLAAVARATASARA